MDRREITAMDLHSALSSLLFAVDQEMGPLGFVRISYSEYVYLQVHVECRRKNRDAVVAKLHHGVLWGPFDYRFRYISYPTMGEQPDDFIEVSAMIDIQASKAPSGPINYNETPEQLRRAQQEYEWGWRRHG